MGNYFEKACEVFYSTNEALGPGIEIYSNLSILKMTSLLDSRHACSNVQLHPADFTIHTPLQSMAGRSAIFVLQSIRRSFRAVCQI